MTPNPQVLATTSTFHITFLASGLIWIMFAGLLVLWIIDGKIKKEEALHAFIAALIAWGVTEMIKSLFPIPRPFVMNGEIPLTVTIPNDASFPSTHSAVAFSLASTVWRHERKWGNLFLILALLVAIGRILSNVHTIPDVAVGGIIGIATFFILEKMHVESLLK